MRTHSVSETHTQRDGYMLIGISHWRYGACLERCQMCLVVQHIRPSTIPSLHRDPFEGYEFVCFSLSLSLARACCC